MTSSYFPSGSAPDKPCEWTNLACASKDQSLLLKVRAGAVSIPLVAQSKSATSPFLRADLSKDALLFRALNKRSSADVVRALLEVGAQVNATAPDDGRSALHKAVIHSPRAVVEALLAAGADVNQPSSVGETPLFSMVIQGDAAGVQLLIDQGAHVNACAASGELPLHRAVVRASPDVAKVLVQAGAHLNVPTRNGETPLYRAIKLGNPQMVAALIGLGGKFSYCSLCQNRPDLVAAIHQGLNQRREYVARHYHLSVRTTAALMADRDSISLQTTLPEEVSLRIAHMAYEYPPAGNALADYLFPDVSGQPERHLLLREFIETRCV